MENRLARLVVAHGVQGLLAAIADTCAILAAEADNTDRHDIAVRLRHDERLVLTACAGCKAWDLSGISHCVYPAKAVNCCVATVCD